MKKVLYGLFVVFVCCISCQEEQQPLEFSYADEKDFEEAKEVSLQLADGFNMELWAPGPLLSNAVALSFDHEGNAYVAETSRRKSSDIDIRAHRDWVTEDLALETLEDTRKFHLEKLATELSEQNTWQEDFNEDGIHDYRDLEVQTEYIKKIMDTDGDGRADASYIFAEGFNEMLAGVAAGVLHYDNQVFVTNAPNVWKLKDKNQDGIADEKTNISYGYGIHIGYAGHDMSGLTMGVDGRLYWSIGDLGVNVVDQDGKRWSYPHHGAVMRCNPDGSDFEVFAHGLRNPQELAFDNYGNLFSVDNDGDHPGEHERYVHIIQGSDSGWRTFWQFGKYNQPNESYKIWMDEKLYLPHFEGQAAYIIPPLKLAYDGPAGLAFNPGTALNEEWKDYFFASYFKASSARSKIQAFKVAPKGSSFEIVEEKDVVSGIVPTGITFAPDGALYINDWKDSYAKKLEGRIWKLDVNDKSATQRSNTQQLLKEGMQQKTAEELSNLLAHADQRVRMAAQFELVKRKDYELLLEVATSDKELFARLHAIWGLGQLTRAKEGEVAPLFDLLNDASPHIKAQTAKVLGEAKAKEAANQLIQLLADESSSVQFFATEALGKLSNPAAFQPLIALLGKIEDQDPHLRHAIILALSKLNQETALANLKDHPSTHVRIGATVALRRMQSPKVTAFLNDESPLVQLEAARAINDDGGIPAALSALATSLNTSKHQNEAFIRRAINANLRIADAKSTQRLATYILNEQAPIAMRLDALWALGYWANPPVLDRVDGSYQKLAGHQLADAQAAFAPLFDQLLHSDLQAAIIEAAGRLEYKAAEPVLFAQFQSNKVANNTKVAILQSLAQLESPNLTTAIQATLNDENIQLRQQAQSLINKIDLPTATVINLFEQILENSTIQEKQEAFASLAKIDDPKAAQLLQTWFNKLMQKSVAPDLQLDILMAIESSNFEELKAQKAEYESQLAEASVFEQYEVSLLGGDAEKGRNIFANNNAAQCLRCHVVQGYGGAVGPELTHIGSILERKDLLLSLVAPNARIAPGYGTVNLTLDDGSSLIGVLEEETEETLVVKEGKDAIRTIKKEEIAEKSMLPSGMFNMATVLDKSQIRDLVAFLVTLE